METKLTIFSPTQDDSLEQADPPINLIPKIDLVPHTIFLLCGPTSSGKSQFAEDIRVLAEVNNLTSTVVSSDMIRRTLLKESPLSPLASTGNRYSDSMTAVSGQAFSILDAQFRAAIQFPVNTEIVVVDTTGMNEGFRKFIIDEGHANSYKVILVTFEYKNRADYFPPGVSAADREIIENSVIRFRRKILPNFGADAAKFDGRIRIKDKQAFGWDLPRSDSWWYEGVSADWEDTALSPLANDKLSLYEKTRDLHTDCLHPETPAAIFGVIGDSHECTKELKRLVTALEEIPGIRIVHVGDYLDKGGDTTNMVNFMYERFKKGDIIIIGNHEAYVYRRLHKEIDPNEELEKSYFTSVPVLENDADLAAKFFDIFEASVPFAVLCDYSRTGGLPVYVTHAPCENRFLGKVHDYAMREQRNYRARDRTVDAFTEFGWLYREADHILPLHIFGHVSHSISEGKGGLVEKLKYKNKVFLDTGAVHGEFLTAVIVQDGSIIDTRSVKCETRIEEVLPKCLGSGPKPGAKPFSIYDYDLEERDLRLLEQVEARGVRYISGTMAPAPSTQTEIEPLDGALDWFRKAGATSVTIQPKYMGSRCQLYLFEDDPKKTFAVSRGGWVIRGVHGKTPEEYQAFLESQWGIHEDLLASSGDTVLDGELMPWSALGHGLIDDAFTAYHDLVSSELEILAGDEGFAELTEFAGKFDVAGRKVELAKFSEALARYSQVGDPEFKAFKILHREKEDSSEQGNLGFHLVNQDEALLISLDGEAPGEKDLTKAHDFFHALTIGKGMEGVVAKPVGGTCELPYLKVRSPEYLRLVYGYDYTREERHGRLCRQKNVSGKVKVSIAEHKLATAMLTATGDAKKELVVKMIGQMKQEKLLDPRL